MCADCLADMPTAGLARDVPLVDKVYVRFLYEARAAQAVRRLKFDRCTSLVPTLSALLLDEVRGVLADFDAVVPVPIHVTRHFERGFNQAEVLVRRWPCRVEPRLLRRTRRTRPQVGLSMAERLTNLEGAFTACEVEGLRILLVDDVVTSGGTVAACADALRRAGAAAVSAAAFCGEKLEA